MAKFNVIDAETGEVKYSGRPKYNGVYCKVSYLEFSEIASPTPIDWKVGDYVVYTRTGLTYRLFDIPQPKKQARRNEYGGAFIYSNVQFHADTKRLEIEPFRDVVIEDNDIHFSTRESWSVYTNVADLIQRFQAVMDEARPGEWEFRLLDIESGGSFNGAFSFAFQQGDTTAATELHDLLYNNYQNFTISGDSVLGGLDKVYSQWNNIGWMHFVEDGKNVIVVGIPSMRIVGVGTDAPGRYLYGKGNGLLSLKKTFANKDDLRTRLFVYGSTRNMIPRYYNNLEPHIKDHESVDIQHLMIPLSEWGETDGEKDASKAYIEANTETFGVRPDSVYFDGRDLEEIYPSIEGLTIGALYDAMASGAQYRPSLSKWDRDDCLDEIVAASGIIDDGMESQGGDKYTQSQSLSTEALGDSKVEDFSKDIIPSFTLGYSGKVHVDFGGLQATIYDTNSVVQTFSSRLEVIVGKRSLFYDVEWSKSGTTYTLNIPNVDARCSAGETLTVRLYVSFTERKAANPIIISAASTTAYLQYAVSYGNTFVVTVPQIGFDIATRAALGSQGIATLSMKDGMCGGRSFVVKSCKYNSTLDAWELTVYRGKDDSLDMLFPNTTYTIAAGDHFVLLDIAMPDTYITMNEQRLLARGRELLADVSRIKSFYEPEIDAEFMVNSGRDLREGWYIALRDTDIIGVGMTEYVLVDTLTINEGESNIPTYKITLRERKKLTYSRTGSTEGGIGLTSLAGGTATEGTTDSGASKQNKLTEEQLAALSFFSVVEVNGHPCIKLNTTYDGLFADGFVSAGGIGTSGGGGTGTVTGIKLGPTTYEPASGSTLINLPFVNTKTDIIAGSTSLVSAGAIKGYVDEAVGGLANSSLTIKIDGVEKGTYDPTSGIPVTINITSDDFDFDGTAYGHSLEIASNVLALKNSDGTVLSTITGDDIYGLFSSSRKNALDSGATEVLIRQITTNKDNITSLTTRVGAAETGITSLEGRMDTAEEDIDTAEGNISDLQTELTRVGALADKFESWFGFDASKNMIYVKNAGGAAGSPNDRGFFAYGSLSAGGTGTPGGGGGGGGDLPHVFLTEAEYEALEIKDPGTIYCTYEED